MGATVLTVEAAVANWSGVFLHENMRTSLGVAALGYVAFTGCQTAGRLVGDRLLARGSAARLLRTGTVVAAGGLAVVVTAFLAAVYLCHDAAVAEPALVPVFRRRALGGAIVAGALALALLPVLPSTAEFHLDRAAGFIALSGCAGVVTLFLLWHGRFRAARVSAALAVAAILWGWAAAQYPALIVGHLTVTSAAATGPALRATFGVLLGGLILLAPALAILFRVFSREENPARRS